MSHSKVKVKRKGLGAPSLIVLMFLGSAALRLVGGVDGAVAQTTSAIVEKTGSLHEKELPGTPFSAPQERERLSILLAVLTEQEAGLAVREEQQEKRQIALNLAAREIKDRLVEMEMAENKLRQTLAIADGAAEGDLSRLTTVYESMKPKDAAALFEAMKPDFAAGFLGRMRPDAAAKVLAGLTPELAYTISVILAGRNASAPKS